MVKYEDVMWRKSTVSGKYGNCVLVGRAPADEDTVYIGDTKAPGVICAQFSLAEWRAFREGMVNLGEFNF